MRNPKHPDKVTGSARLRPNSITLSSSRAGRRHGFLPVADRFELSRHVEITGTWSQTGSQLVYDLIASWIAHDRPNSITLSSSLAGRRLAREPARELDTSMEFGLYHTCHRSMLGSGLGNPAHVTIPRLPVRFTCMGGPLGGRAT